ncbi:dual CXXC motif small (seleno)protein [Desulfovibrio sp. Fe33]|uniref:dual CXXC motif small (seleno)protein n=1 Tax=Desulfovibrio sp. Fe33 TaxID=3020842 RepID=UPI00234DA7B0|nr:dual CXXC motif small (seleno)protein [Desulfovibrio sp. Fe33]
MTFGRKRTWLAKGMKCEKCGLDLTTYRGCREVTLKCPSCGEVYDLREFSARMDEDFEEEMGFVPMDRI